MKNALKEILWLAFSLSVICPLVPTYNDADIENQVCPPSHLMQQLAKHQKDFGERLEGTITSWTELNGYDDLPRALFESYYLMRTIAGLERKLFSEVVYIPTKHDNVYLMGKDGILKDRAKAVVDAAFQGHILVRPQISADMRESAEYLFDEIATFVRVNDYGELDLPALVGMFERKVYGNLDPKLRMTRLMNALSCQTECVTCSRLNPVALLVAYLQWPGFPSERPSLTPLKDHSMQQLLEFYVLNPADKDYDFAQPTSFDALIAEKLTIQKRASWSRKTMRTYLWPPAIMGCMLSMVEGDKTAATDSTRSLSIYLIALYGLDFAIFQYERSVAKTEKHLLKDHSLEMKNLVF